MALLYPHGTNCPTTYTNSCFRASDSAIPYSLGVVLNDTDPSAAVSAAAATTTTATNVPFFQQLQSQPKVKDFQQQYSTSAGDLITTTISSYPQEDCYSAVAAPLLTSSTYQQPQLAHAISFPSVPSCCYSMNYMTGATNVTGPNPCSHAPSLVSQVSSAGCDCGLSQVPQTTGPVYIMFNGGESTNPFCWYPAIPTASGTYGMASVLMNPSSAAANELGGGAAVLGYAAGCPVPAGIHGPIGGSGFIGRGTVSMQNIPLEIFYPQQPQQQLKSWNDATNESSTVNADDSTSFLDSGTSGSANRSKSITNIAQVKTKSMDQIHQLVSQPDRMKNVSAVSGASTKKRLVTFENNILYKTELCKEFAQESVCPRGEICQFAHGELELRDPRTHPLFCSSLCRELRDTGHCTRQRCFHAHSRKELKAVVSCPTTGTSTEVPRCASLNVILEEKQAFTKRRDSLDSRILPSNPVSATNTAVLNTTFAVPPRMMGARLESVE